MIQNAFTQAEKALEIVDGWVKGTAKEGEKVIVPSELITIDISILFFNKKLYQIGRGR